MLVQFDKVGVGCVSKNGPSQKRNLTSYGGLMHIPLGQNLRERMRISVDD